MSCFPPQVGDRVRTSFNSYGTITAIRPAAIRPIDPAKVKPKPAKDTAAAPIGSKDYVDPTLKRGEDRNKIHIEMPPDFILKTSKMGPFAGAVEKKGLEDEARRIASGGKPRVPATTSKGGASQAEVVKTLTEKPRLVAEIWIETEP